MQGLLNSRQILASVCLSAGKLLPVLSSLILEMVLICLVSHFIRWGSVLIDMRIDAIGDLLADF